MKGGVRANIREDALQNFKPGESLEEFHLPRMLVVSVNGSEIGLKVAFGQIVRTVVSTRRAMENG